MKRTNRSTRQSGIPKAIRHIAGIQAAPLFEPGVYFLIDQGEVVYVGQSISPTRRIGDHISEAAKVFDEAFVLETPRSTLDQVEATFIHLLKPKYNVSEGRVDHVTRASQSTLDILSSIASRAGFVQRSTQAGPASAEELPTRSIPSSKPAPQIVPHTALRDRLLRLPEVEAHVGVKKSSIYAWLKTGEFPQPVRVGPRTVAWKGSDIEEWIATRDKHSSQRVSLRGAEVAA